MGKRLKSDKVDRVDEAALGRIVVIDRVAFFALVNILNP